MDTDIRKSLMDAWRVLTMVTVHDDGSRSQTNYGHGLNPLGDGAIIGKRADWRSLYVHFAGAIQRDHLYWKSWEGVCDPVKQSKNKMFVTPFGYLSSIHYGAFPHGHIDAEAELSRWDVGRSNGVKRFLDVLGSPDPIPEVPWSCLNPFELMLSLEIEREARDRAWGLPVSCSPYHTSRRQEISHELVDAWRQGGAHTL